MLTLRFVRTEIFGHPSKYHWEIWERKNQIGEITYMICGKYVILGHLDIFSEYRKQHFGYKAIEFLMKKYPTKSIVGETLSTSTGFWKKCIKKYNGARKNISYCINCTSSFIIPKRDITYDELWDCLEIAYKID